MSDPHKPSDQIASGTLPPEAGDVEAVQQLGNPELIQAGIDYLKGIRPEVSASISEKEARGMFSSEHMILRRRSRLTDERTQEKFNGFLANPPEDYDIHTYLSVVEAAEGMVVEDYRQSNYAKFGRSFCDGINTILDRDDVDGNEVFKAAIGFILPRTKEGYRDAWGEDDGYYWRKVVNVQGFGKIYQEIDRRGLDSRKLPDDIAIKFRFWRRAKFAIKYDGVEVRDDAALMEYVMNRGIADKDPEPLQEFIDTLDDGTFKQKLHPSHRSLSAMERKAYDAFGVVLDEADGMGWRNAGGLKESLNVLAKRDIPFPQELLFCRTGLSDC